MVELKTLSVSRTRAVALTEHFGSLMKFIASSTSLQIVIFEDVRGLEQSHLSRLNSALTRAQSGTFI